MSTCATTTSSSTSNPSPATFLNPVYAYQVDPARAIMDSISNSHGEEILLIMSRQSGKNETVSQLLTYLLNLLHRSGGNNVCATDY